MGRSDKPLTYPVRRRLNNKTADPASAITIAISPHSESVVTASTTLKPVDPAARLVVPPVVVTLISTGPTGRSAGTSSRMVLSSNETSASPAEKPLPSMMILLPPEASV